VSKIKVSREDGDEDKRRRPEKTNGQNNPDREANNIDSKPLVRNCFADNHPEHRQVNKNPNADKVKRLLFHFKGLP